MQLCIFNKNNIMDKQETNRDVSQYIHTNTHTQTPSTAVNRFKYNRKLNAQQHIYLKLYTDTIQFSKAPSVGYMMYTV